MWQAITGAFANIDKFHAFYEANLRSDLFNGFLALAGFLLAAKTFILVHMQKELYSSDGYYEHIKDLRKYKPDTKVFAPLRRLGELLYWSVLFSFATAIAQVTIGFVDHWWSAVLCTFLAAVTTIIMIVCMRLIWSNLKDWFEELERTANKQLAAANQKKG